MRARCVRWGPGLFFCCHWEPRMPLTNRPQTGEVERMEGPEKKIRKRILVVDDEERICDAVKRALERTGYQVEASLSALGALEVIHKGALDMVICDIKMPGMDGMSLLDRIKEFDPNIPVLMITGYASIESAVEAV